MVKIFQYSGNYCVHDIGWRGSVPCSVIGTLFSISTQGSLLTAMMMSVTRCYTCLAPFSDQSYSLTILLHAVLLVASFLLCSIPLLPVNFIQDVVKTTLFFEANPITSKANHTLLSNILSTYTGVTQDNSTSYLISALTNVTSNPNLFRISHSFGFYSQSPLCININTTNPALVFWRLLNILLITSIIAIVSVSYILISVYSRKNQPQGAANIPNTQAKERMNFLSVKVTIIIISQISSWIPVLIASALSLFNIDIHPIFYEYVAIVILPINSIADPVLYTSSLKGVFNLGKKIVGMLPVRKVDEDVRLAELNRVMDTS